MGQRPSFITTKSAYGGIISDIMLPGINGLEVWLITAGVICLASKICVDWNCKQAYPML